MKFKVIENLEINESLKSEHPYMLRNDGKLFDVTDSGLMAHPYIKYEFNYDDEEAMIELITGNPRFLVWFYKHTNSKELKEDIEMFIHSIYRNYPKLFKNVAEYFEDINYENARYTDIESGIYEMYNLINNATNQEFCRVRLGDKYYGNSRRGSIYFRISSKRFNWFNLIWELVYNNKNEIKDVSIVRDSQTFGEEEIYSHKGIKLLNLPIEEFINLTGNPIIENKNNNFYEMIRICNSYFMNKRYNSLKEEYEI